MARTVKHTWVEDLPTRPTGFVCKICSAQAYFSRETFKIETHVSFNKDCSKQLVTSVLLE